VSKTPDLREFLLMLPGLTIPASFVVLMEAFRSCFAAPTFDLFRVLVVGLIGQTGRRTVCGMLLGAGAAEQIAHHRAHRFFSAARWSVDQLGLALARLILDRVVEPDAAIQIAIDDTLFRRRGKKVHHAFWSHDASQAGQVFARGNRWVIVALVVELPFLSRPVCLPVLFRLWAGKDTATPVALARELVGLLARAFPGRVVHVAADAAYHGPALRDLPAHITWTTRLSKNSVLYQLPGSRTGRRGRPAIKGARIGTPTQAADYVTWRTLTVTRYGRTDTVEVGELPCLWYGAFGPRPGRLILVRDRHATMALFTTDTTSHAADIVNRYASRWTIEVAIETAKGPMGIGQARNRTPLAVERTIPFSMITMSLVTVWYALYGHHPDDITNRRQREPWYTTKTEPSFEDMIAKLRRTLIAARFMPQRPSHATPEQINAVHQAWQAAAA
jgi:DDE superfamily endonuclease